MNQNQMYDQRLFDDSPAYTIGDPASHGFYNLERPHNMRWIMVEADCRLPVPNATLTRPALMVRANSGPFERRYLTVFVNGMYVDTQPVTAYGCYYFDLNSALLDMVAGTAVVVTFRVNKADVALGDSRQLGLGLYEVRLLDLDMDGERFNERELFLDQLRLFESSMELGKTLRKDKLDPQSRILDIGAGLGWSSTLLALFTGARVVAVDLHHYDAPTCVPFKADLRFRMLRHFSVLQRAKEFAHIAEFAEVERAINRCTFLSMSAEDLLLRDDLFDFVFSLNAFEHIQHPDIALAEIERTLRPGGEAFIIAGPLYYSDRGHHLHSDNLFDRPWVHLLHNREEIKLMIAAEGKSTNEVDNILNSLNGWRPSQFETMYKQSGMEVISHHVQTGVGIPGANQSESFCLARKLFSLEDLTTIGIKTHLRKKKGGTKS